MRSVLLAVLMSALALVSGVQGADDKKIVSIGSDTMSHLMKNTAEAFKGKHPAVTVEVQEPGSAAGIGALINNQSDLCPSSRPMKPEEIEKFAASHNGEKPVEIRVSLDGIVIYVNKSNPINQLTMEQIGRIFSENPDSDMQDKAGKPLKKFGAKAKTWGDIDPTLPEEWKNAKIILYSRNAASGTYGYFKEVALGNRDFDKNCQEMPGTSSVVNGVEKDKFSIGYGGIGYKTEAVKILPVAPKEGAPAVAPTIESVSARQYPISRALQIYAPKKPTGIVKEYLEFILSPEGQAVIAGEKVGFVPLPEPLRLKELERLK
jgi:phosphate transport system substrate-binding protein